MIEYGLVVTVGIIWGVTNPFLEKNAKQVESKDNTDNTSFSNLWSNFSRVSVIMPFLINQLGSILNVFALSKVELSIGNMIANSTSILFTFIV